MYRMKGVIPPVVTPFKQNGEVDYDGVKKLSAFLKQNVDGMFITGSYGSCAMLQPDERKKIAEVTMKEVAGKIPVVIHVGTADSLSAADLTRHAVNVGAAAVSAVGPYYYKHNEDDICEYYSQIVKAAEGKVPVYVYNNSSFQGYTMSLNLLKRLKNDVGVNGVKDATFDIMAHANYNRVLKDEHFDVALGTEAMWLSACVLGCEAFIPGIGNALPEICHQMYVEGMAKEFDKLRETQFKVNEIRDIMYLARSTQLAVYAMLEIRGILSAYPRSPFIPASEQEKKNIEARLKELAVL